MTIPVNDYILIAVLILSVYLDLTQKKIPNLLTFPVMGWGLCSYTLYGGGDGFLFSSYGLLLGLALLFIPFALGGMGAGDVKLLGAIGALKGAQFVLSAGICTALLGGIIAVVYLAISRRLGRVLKRIIGVIARPIITALSIRFGPPFSHNLILFFSPPDSRPEPPLYFPYGVAIGLGTMLVLIGVAEQIVPLSGLF